VTAQAKQATEHDEMERVAGNKHGNELESTASGPTGTQVNGQGPTESEAMDG